MLGNISREKKRETPPAPAGETEETEDTKLLENGKEVKLCNFFCWGQPWALHDKKDIEGLEHIQGR